MGYLLEVASMHGRGRVWVLGFHWVLSMYLGAADCFFELGSSDRTGDAITLLIASLSVSFDAVFTV